MVDIVEALFGENMMGKQKKNEQILKHQMEEWKYLNSYIIQMDLNYQQSFTVMISIFAGATVLFTSDVKSDLLMGIFIIPPGIIAVFAYLSYQFRITAILRGHLAALEREMNVALKEDVHMWNSALVEVFMAHNNSINKNMMLPMLVFILVIIIYCCIFTWKASLRIPCGIQVFVVYWVLMFVGALIVLVPFWKNEKIRHETEKHDKVKRLYQKFLLERKDKI